MEFLLTRLVLLSLRKGNTGLSEVSPHIPGVLKTSRVRKMAKGDLKRSEGGSLAGVSSTEGPAEPQGLQAVKDGHGQTSLLKGCLLLGKDE
jgi:hypothetical protein